MIQQSCDKSQLYIFVIIFICASVLLYRWIINLHVIKIPTLVFNDILAFIASQDIEYPWPIKQITCTELIVNSSLQVLSQYAGVRWIGNTTMFTKEVRIHTNCKGKKENKKENKLPWQTPTTVCNTVHVLTDNNNSTSAK